MFEVGQSCYNFSSSPSAVLPCLSSRMGSALLSRFDLVFILLDTPNEDHDHLLSEHVMAMRAGRRAACSSALVTRASSQEHSVLQATSDRPLLERLKVGLVLALLHEML